MATDGDGERPGPRPTAYDELVGALADARDDAATARFDAELTAALDRGAVTPEAARALRFWQRAAQRSFIDHLRSTLPPALGAIEAARRDSRAGVVAAEASWRSATEDGPGTPVRAEDGETASTSAGVAPSSLVERRRRMIVAGLTDSAPPDVAAPDRA